MFVCLGIGSFFEIGSDETFGFSVGFWGLWPCGGVLNAPCFQSLTVTFFVSDTIVGHDALHVHAVFSELFHCVSGEDERAVSGLIGEYFRVGQTRMVVDGDV